MDGHESLLPAGVGKSTLATSGADMIHPPNQTSMRCSHLPSLSGRLSLGILSAARGNRTIEKDRLCDQQSSISQEHEIQPNQRKALLEMLRSEEYSDHLGPFQVTRPVTNEQTGDAVLMEALQPRTQSKSRSKNGKRRFRWDEHHNRLLEELVRNSRLTNNSSDKKLVCQVFPGFSQRFVKQQLKEVINRQNSQVEWRIEDDAILFKYFLKGITDWSKVQEIHFPNKTVKQVCERVDALRRSQLKKIAHLGKRQSVSPHVDENSEAQKGRIPKWRLSKKSSEICEKIDTLSKFHTISTCLTFPTDSSPTTQDTHRTNLPNSTQEQTATMFGREVQVYTDTHQETQTKDPMSDLPRLHTNKTKLFSFEVRIDDELLQPDGLVEDPLWNDGANISKLLHTTQDDSWLSWHT